AYDSLECTIIFSKTSVSWGHYFYDEREDALRVNVKPQHLDKSVEWLRYEFLNETNNSAVIAMEWEKLRIPFTVEVDLIETSLADFRQEIRGGDAWVWEALEQAAEFCLQYNTHLDEGLAWSKNAVLENRSFQTLSTESDLLALLNHKAEADALMKDAMKLASMGELHQYGKELLKQKRTTEALDVFKENARRNPGQFVPLVGLARGYSATGDLKNALKQAKLAQPLAPDESSKHGVAELITKLEQGKDIN
ncbi:MAG TPA: DUF2911 domain-containing protein, partial [Bacteroidia bacterium]|nr:DUF2911 domain-containing protein [Bacteroidia bacterium]